MEFAHRPKDTQWEKRLDDETHPDFIDRVREAQDNKFGIRLGHADLARRILGDDIVVTKVRTLHIIGKLQKYTPQDLALYYTALECTEVTIIDSEPIGGGKMKLIVTAKGSPHSDHVTITVDNVHDTRWRQDGEANQVTIIAPHGLAHAFLMGSQDNVLIHSRRHVAAVARFPRSSETH